MSGSPERAVIDAAEALRQATPPVLGVVLGSGLGAFADALTDRTVIAYERIPHFPRTRVEVVPFRIS